MYVCHGSGSLQPHQTLRIALMRQLGLICKLHPRQLGQAQPPEFEAIAIYSLLVVTPWRPDEECNRTALRIPLISGTTCTDAVGAALGSYSNVNDLQLLCTSSSSHSARAPSLIRLLRASRPFPACPFVYC